MIRLVKPKVFNRVVETSEGWCCPKCRKVLSRVAKNYTYEHCMYCGTKLNWGS